MRTFLTNMNKSYQIGELKRVKNIFLACNFMKNGSLSKILIFNGFLVEIEGQIQFGVDVKNFLDFVCI